MRLCGQAGFRERDAAGHLSQNLGGNAPDVFRGHQPRFADGRKITNLIVDAEPVCDAVAAGEVLDLVFSQPVLKDRCGADNAIADGGREQGAKLRKGVRLPPSGGDHYFHRGMSQQPLLEQGHVPETAALAWMENSIKIEKQHHTAGLLDKNALPMVRYGGCAGNCQWSLW